jgi:hypothetical protein
VPSRASEEEERDAGKSARQVAQIAEPDAEPEGDLMDPRLKDPKVQVEVFKQLTSAGPVDRHAAHAMLRRNGYDVERSVTEAKRWKAIQEAQQGQLTTPSNPNLDAKTAKNLTSIFARGSSIAKAEA